MVTATLKEKLNNTDLHRILENKWNATDKWQEKRTTGDLENSGET
jgi:hypothetical protein